MPSSHLTAKEHSIIDRLGSVCVDICNLDGTIPGDRAEAVLHTHALQNMVLARAAARAYPDRYRL